MVDYIEKDLVFNPLQPGDSPLQLLGRQVAFGSFQDGQFTEALSNENGRQPETIVLEADTPNLPNQEAVPKIANQEAPLLQPPEYTATKSVSHMIDEQILAEGTDLEDHLYKEDGDEDLYWLDQRAVEALAVIASYDEQLVPRTSSTTVYKRGAKKKLRPTTASLQDEYPRGLSTRKSRRTMTHLVAKQLLGKMPK